MILRSFSVRGAGGALPREGNFVAKVSEFLGVAARPDGFAILTLCDEAPRATRILLPTGGTALAAAPGAQCWDFFVRVDNEEPPAARKIRGYVNGDWKEGAMQPRFLGGAALGEGVAFVFVMPHEPPEGTEFVS